jgi:hypothetical protein
VKTFRAERCFPCLAWGRRWASRFRGCLRRQWPRRRTPLQPFRTPLRPTPASAILNPRRRMGSNAGKSGAAIARSDATAAMSDGAHAAPKSQPRRQPQPLQRNSNPPLRTDRQDEQSLMLSSSCSRNGRVVLALRSKCAAGGEGGGLERAPGSHDECLALRGGA